MCTVLFLAALVGAGSVQQIGVGPGGRAPIVYRLEGYLEEAPEGMTIDFRTIVGFGAKERAYLITSYQRQGNGNPFDLFRNLGMFRPDFILMGPKKPLEALIGAKAGSRVSGTFYYRRGMRVLEVDPHSLKIE
jgi:hypothetical protein